MKKIYVKDIDSDFLKLNKEQSLKLKYEMGLNAGDLITVSDGEKESIFIIAILEDSGTVLKFCYRHETAEPDISATMYIGMPRDNKLDNIIRSTVELGITEIVPVETNRSVKISDLGDINALNKRFNKIARETAIESGREVIPSVSRILTLKEAVKNLNEKEILFFYELGGRSLRTYVKDKNQYTSLAIFIGPEGGFEKDEADLIISKGAKAVTLGRRILSCETVPVATLSAIMILSGNLEQ